ncbi:MAG: heme ABC transporter permease [Legionellales bacterium]|nr:heme ABC transporter permease [Legionellales bacterium]
MNGMWQWFHKLSSPRYFYRFSSFVLPWCWGIFSVLFIYGLIGGLVLAPADYKQGDGFRIIYLHVPAALMSILIFAVMAVNAVIFLIWKIKLADVIAKVSAPIGASMAFLALFTGAVWGKPMWGTWWVWDARLTSELILLFLYLGYIALRNAISDPTISAKASSVMAIVGAIDLPIIHYSVIWWNTLHQGASISLFQHSTIASSMLQPLIIMIFAFYAFYISLLLSLARPEILWRERDKRWVYEVMHAHQ